jgi:O-succinylbenzoic acid--CoA ligase
MFRGLPEIRFTSDERSCLVISDELIHPEPIVTNDRVEILSPSIFRLLGRVDNVINSGGVKIQPEELETVLAKYIHGKFCISSIPDTTLGNVVVLVVEKGTDLTVFEQHIEDIPPYQRPRKIIEIPVFPQTSSGKTDMEEVRRFLRQWTIDN